MPLPVVILPEADTQLDAIEQYIAEESRPETAKRYVDKIVARCELIGVLPRGGRPRNDLEPGLRSISFKGRVTILYRVSAETVQVAGVYYGGQDIGRHFAALRG